MAKAYYWHRFYASQPDLNGGDAGLFNGLAPDMGASESSLKARTVLEENRIFRAREILRHELADILESEERHG